MKAATTVMVSLALVICIQPLWANPFTEVIVFGDSHSDTGNWGSSVGRFSNGPVWVEELASELGLPPPQPSGSGGTNYAWGGAKTGWGYDSFQTGGQTFPKVGTQISLFLSNREADAHQLYVLFAGHNDFGWGGQRDASVPVSNLSEHISTLAQAGGRDFVVSNLLPLGQIPSYRGTQNEIVLDSLATQYNDLLAEEIGKLEASLDINVHEVDFHGLVQEIVNDPPAFGMSNVTDAAEGNPQSDPDEYLYWDDNHFTSAVHERFGGRAAAAIVASGRALTLRRSLDAVYLVKDSDSTFDDLGDTTSAGASKAAAAVGERDTADNNVMARLVAKFGLSEVPDGARRLGSAKVQFFLEDILGAPAGPVSLFHSVADNDLDGVPSDYEDDGYVDTLLDLVQPTDVGQHYYELDVTDLVRRDYENDGDNPTSAFRLQVNEAVFLEDDQSQRYRFAMPGAASNPPELVLTFIPEPSALVLAALGLLGLFAHARRRNAA